MLAPVRTASGSVPTSLQPLHVGNATNRFGPDANANANSSHQEEQVWPHSRVRLAEAEERTAFWDWQDLFLGRCQVGHLQLDSSV